MAGTKRRRAAGSAGKSGSVVPSQSAPTANTNTSSATTSSAASSSKNAKKQATAKSNSTSTSTPTSTMTKLIERLVEISSNEQRATSVLQAFGDSKIVDNWDSYWILLATHVIHRLVVDQAETRLLAPLCDLLSRIMASDKTKLEKSMAVATGRWSAARAILAATIGALQCLTRSTMEEPSPQRFVVLLAATATLDRMVHLQSQSPPHSQELPLVDWKTQNIDAACTLVPCTPEEEEFLLRLEQVQAASSPIKTTARATRRKSSASTNSTSADITALTQALEAMQGDSANQRMDARVAVKRWASSAIVWYRRGPLQILRCIHHLATERKENIFHLSRLLCRLLAVVAESGINCGLRPPVGVVDQYLTSFSASHPSDGHAENGRVDIRDWMVVAVHDILQLHRLCLLESQSPICNDTNEPATPIMPNHTLDSNVFTSPSLAVILPSLCRAAASSVADAGFSKQNEWNKALTAIVTAMCFQLIADSAVPLDCRLSHYAIANLAETLRLLLQQSPSASAALGVDATERVQTLERTFHLSKPLPQPVCPPYDTNADHLPVVVLGTHSKSNGVFAGMWNSRNDFTNEDALALVLRAMHDFRDDNDDEENDEDMLEENTNQAQGKLLKVLTSLTRRVLDTRFQPKRLTTGSTTVDEVDLDTKPMSKGSRKRAMTTTGGRKKKQPKTTKDQTPTEQQETHIMGEYKRLSSARASLAKDILTTLRHSLIVQNIPCSIIAHSIRDMLNSTILKDLIALGDLLDKVLVKNRAGASRFSTSPSSAANASASDIPTLHNVCVHSNEFTSHEKDLWSAHMSMCQVVGRGQADYDGVMRDVFTTSQRNYIVQCIAGGRSASWPLSLPAAHHALLQANFTSQSVELHESAPEQFLVLQCIKSIRKALQNFHEIQTPPKIHNCLFLDDGILLSYKDARTLLLAFSRLSAEEQRKHVESLITVLLQTFKSVQGDKDKQRDLTNKEEACTFVARVVVTCSAMVSMLAYGQQLRQALLANAGPSSIHPPGFYSVNEWYYCERTFMGLVADWECSAIPDLDSLLAPPNWTLLSDKSLQHLRSMLEMAFAIGFETARKDQCYLLFAAWNGLGKLYTEGAAERLKLSDSISLQINAENYPKRILQLRDDMCMIHLELGKISGGQRTIPSTKLRSNLKSTLNRANILLGRLLENATTDEEIPMSLFSLLAALPTYISSSISAHTIPGRDFFSSVLSTPSSKEERHQRTYSSGSDDADSVDTDEGGNETSTRIDAASRLRECCDAFGAAPTHPDWLDVTCSFQEGIRTSDAVDNAETALRMLNKLVATSFENYKKHFIQAVEAYKPNSVENVDLVALAVELLPWTTHEPTFQSPLGPGTYSDDRDWKEDVGLLCELPDGLLDLVMDDTLVKNIETAKESWCPNSALRLRGRLQDKKRPLSGWETSVPELRAGGEWELLLAEALTTACLDVKQYPEDVAEDAFESDDDPCSRLDSSRVFNVDDEKVRLGHNSLKQAHIWRTILAAATSHMVPAAALLRMGINKTGRKPHPFSFRENHQDPYDVAPLTFSECLSTVSHTSQLVKQTVHETMAILSMLSAHGDDGLSSTCHAIAAQLMVHTRSFSDMEGLQSIRLAFRALEAVLRLIKSNEDNATSIEVFPFIVERLTLVLEDYSHTPGDNETDQKDQNFLRLLLFLGASETRNVDTLVGNDVDIFDILKGKGSDEASNPTSWFQWSQSDVSLEAIDHLIGVLCGLPLKSNDRGRACAAAILCNLVTSERRRLNDGSITPSLLPIITNAFNDLSEDHVKNLITENLICFGATPHASYQVTLSHLLQHVMSCGDQFIHAKLIYDVLVESFRSWPRSALKQELEPAIDCLLAFGCRFNSLNEIGATILSLETSKRDTVSDAESVVDLELMTKFFAFVKELSDASSGRGKPSKEEEGNEDDARSDQLSHKDQLELKLARRCSFVEKSGYHGQHWYNCYTCGLVWEKGCCTLCALVCHKGHDVSYSRYSSFFCDCAAEDGASSSQNRTSCRCLVDMPADDIKKLLEAEKADVNVEEQQTPVEGPGIKKILGSELPSLGVEIVLKSFGPSTKSCLADLSKTLAGEPWFLALFNLVRQQFMLWQANKSPASDILPLLEHVKTSSARPSHRVSPPTLRQRLRNRFAQPLELKHLPYKALLPIRSAKGFQTRMSSDTSTNSHLLAKLSRNDITRRNLVADSRGRLIIAEPCSLIFCSSIPAVATRYNSHALDTPISREDMCVLASSPIPFNIIGMSLNPENERHLLVWGVAEACVVIIKPHWDGAETKIDLVLDLDQPDGESDYLVMCGFVPGSQTSLVVGCGHYVRVFDIARSKDNRANAIVAYNLGFDVSLRDIALVPMSPWDCLEGNVATGQRNQPYVMCRMFMLLENGRLHTVDLKADSEGRMESPGDEPCELSGSVSLPTTGVRTRTGSPLGATGSVAKSLGEGSRIVYLRQSRILLYKCVSSCVVALMLDASGNVEGSFELMPHVLSSDVLWSGTDGHSIVGPFNHWTELGVVYNEDGVYFRVACLGRSSRTNQARLVCLEFNEKDVRIKEVGWNTTSSASLNLHLAFEGLCAFSLPFVGDAVRETAAFGERVFLCTTTSTGSLLFYGEDFVDTVETSHEDGDSRISLVALSDASSLHAKQPSFPLTIFERLKNVSEYEAVVFTGDGFGSDSADLKTKLLRDRSSSLVLHRREGSSLSISLRAQSENSLGDDPHGILDHSLDRSHVIVALRLLVGSNTSQVPSKVFVQGRVVALVPRMKKWYSLPLTNEEIALGVRNGMVSLGIGAPFDSSSSSSVDCVEVYVAERDKVARWIPISYIKHEGAKKTEPNSRSMDLQCDSDDSTSGRGLIQSARTLAALCEIAPGSSQNFKEDQRVILRSIVEETAFTRDKRLSEAIRDLVNNLEPSDRLRNSLYDESILRGCMKILDDAKTLCNDSTMTNADESTRWDATRLILRDCLRAVAQIARERPMNYLQCMVNASENDSTGSIATDACELILEGDRRSFPCVDLIDGDGGLIELCLTEIAIELNTDRGSNLAKFDAVKQFLQSSNRDVVQSTCRAVSAFCRRQGATNPGDTDLFRLLQGTRIVAYKCDSCGLCPLKDVRYTFLEEDFDIDLCKECYDIAARFAEKHEYNSAIDVNIEGRTVGADSKLTCLQLRQMQPVHLEKMDVEQVDIGSTSRVSKDNTAMEEDDDLRKALQMSMVDKSSDDDLAEMEEHLEPQAYEDFISFLFSNILDVLSDMIDNHGHGALQLAPLLQLLLDLVRNSNEGGVKLDRARRFARELSKGISHIVSRRSHQGSLPETSIWALVSCIRSVQLLAFFDDKDAESFFQQFHADDDRVPKTNEEVLCDVHGLPAVRRRSAKGKNKDRRFYVCGKERGQRCNFFKWADDVETKSRGKYLISSQMREIIRSYLWNRPFSNISTINAALCELLEQELFVESGEETDGLFFIPSHVHEKRKPNIPLSSNYGKRELERDAVDGVVCSRERLQGPLHDGVSRQVTAQKREFLLHPQGLGDSRHSLLEACLGLLALLADYKTEGSTRWFALLCEIDISSSKVTELRGFARKVLKSLCGKKRTLYHSIRDHFSFGFHLQALYRTASPVLEAALLVAERARVCSPNWSTSTKLDWSSVSYGGLIGTDDLVSGTAISQTRRQQLAKVLDSLLTVVKNAGESWRRFCGQAALPVSHRFARNTSLVLLAAEQHMRESPPIIALFWLACSLSGSNQTKILRLIQTALSKGGVTKVTDPSPQNHNASNPTPNMGADQDLVAAISGADLAAPENILFLGDRRLTDDDMAAFTFHFILGGKSADLRKICSNIATKVVWRGCGLDLDRLFDKVFCSRFHEVGSSGRGSSEYVNFLQFLAKNLDSTFSVRKYGHIVLNAFKDQINAVKYGRSNGDWVVLESGYSSMNKRKFDLSKCSYCVQTITSPYPKEPQKQSERRDPAVTSRTVRRAFSAQSSRTNNSPGKPTSQMTRKWHPEQVSPFSRIRLDALKVSTSSNEFNSFFTLKHRIVITDVFLAVNDARGRFVKNVNVYYSSRPATDASELKSNDYASQWQKCATMTVPRGALRAHASISHPVVAANIKIEYCDFYERPGGSKSSDGSQVVHCPRCTRVVTNAHGVCGNCGEVASQCRKCRHINYDRMDAFLCVECGYCASGSFSVELTAAVASNAIAVESDKDCERLLRILGAVNTIYEEVKTALTRTFQIVEEQNATARQSSSNFNSDINRAFVGLPPILEGGKGSQGSYIDRVDKQGSVVKLAARPESSSVTGRSSIAADRTRSLLRLARQIRSESGSPWDRRRSGDMIIHQLGRGIAVDHIEDERDLIGILEEGNVLESADPLSRTIASVRAAQRDPLNESRFSITKSLTDSNKKESAKEILEECQRLHMLAREALRERCNLQSRIDAWQRLNEGQLIDYGRPIQEKDHIEPCHCSQCGSSVALQLLSLWSHIFSAQPSEVAIDQEFLSLLLSESSLVGKNLSDCMRDVVKDVATKSENGAKLVLKEIRERLLATNDPVSAEILGKIMAVSNHFMSEEYTKLAMDLLARYPG